MPPVVIAVAIAVSAYAAGATLAVALLVFSVASTIGTLIFSQFGNSKPASPNNPTQAAQDRSQTLRSSVSDRVVLYGRVKLSGPLLLAKTTSTDSGGATGSVNNVLDLVVSVAAHKIAGFDEFYVADQEYIDLDGYFGQYGDYVTNTFYTGDVDQTVDPHLSGLASEWTTTHRGQGIAYFISELLFNSNIWTSGIPNLAVVARGKLLFDPRLAATAPVISASAIGNPGVFTTSAAHGLHVRDLIYVQGHTGAVCVDGTLSGAVSREYQIASVPSTTTFTLYDHQGNPLQLTTGGTGGTVTKCLYSNNWALCIRDYLSNWDYGLNTPDSSINDVATIAAANISDEYVTLPTQLQIVVGAVDTTNNWINLPDWSVPTPYGSPPPPVNLKIQDGDQVQLLGTTAPMGAALSTTYYWIAVGRLRGRLATSLANARAGIAVAFTSAGSTDLQVQRLAQLRYTCDGTILCSRKPIDVIDDLKSAGMGNIVWQQGQYSIFAAAYSAPSFTLNDSQLRDSYKYKPRLGRTELYNRVTATFTDPSNSWQPNDMTAVSNAAYAAQDGGELTRDIQFPFTIDDLRCQRLSKIALEKSRDAGTLSFPANWSAFPVTVMSNVSITLTDLGMVDQDFLVLEWSANEDGGIDLVLQAESSESYDWTSLDATVVYPSPTSFPMTSNVATPGNPEVKEQLYITRLNSVKAQAVVTWAPSPDAFVSFYQLEYGLSGTGQFTVLPIVRFDTTSITIDDIQPGTYDFRIKAINSVGVTSDYVTSPMVQVLGLSNPPENVQGLGMQPMSGLANITWDKALDLDVLIGGFVRVRWSPDVSTPVWQNAIDIGPSLPGDSTHVLLPLMAGSYLVRFYNSNGVPSPTAAFVTTNAPTVTVFGNSQTQTESPTFAGAKTNTVVTSGVLSLDSLGDFDLIPDFDSVLDVDGLGGQASSGSYFFDAVMDLGAVEQARLTMTITAAVDNVLDHVDERTGDVDSWDDWDGVVAASVNAKLFVSSTPDDPSGSPTWSPYNPLYAAEYNARAFRFRLDIASADPAYNIDITVLSVTAQW